MLSHILAPRVAMPAIFVLLGVLHHHYHLTRLHRITTTNSLGYPKSSHTPGANPMQYNKHKPGHCSTSLSPTAGPTVSSDPFSCHLSLSFSFTPLFVFSS